MAKAIAEHRFTFITFDCSVYSLAVFVTHFRANVGCVDRWLLARCELTILNLIITIHMRSVKMPPSLGAKLHTSFRDLCRVVIRLATNQLVIRILHVSVAKLNR
jgi:hypothetical protein